MIFGAVLDLLKIYNLKKSNTAPILKCKIIKFKTCVVSSVVERLVQ